MRTKYHGNFIIKSVVQDSSPQPTPIISTAQELVRYYWSSIYNENLDLLKEHLWVIPVNTKYKVIGHNLVSMGCLNESIAHPREIFRPVIVAGAYGFLLIHNHPSDDVTPSTPDRAMVRKIREGAEIFDLAFLDNIIVPSTRNDAHYFSFKESGMM